MAVKLPTSIKVGTITFTFTVTVDPDDWMRAEHETQRVGDYGHTNAMRAIISLNPEQSPDTMRLTLWHEVMHALAEVVMGANDWHGLGKDRDDREETVIRSWESPTLTVLRDNPNLVGYLTASVAGLSAPNPIAQSSIKAPDDAQTADANMRSSEEHDNLAAMALSTTGDARMLLGR